MWAHLPVPYTIIGVTGKWLVSACKYFLRYELFSSLNFGPVTDGQTDRWTESDAYEPTVHKAQVCSKMHTPYKGGGWGRGGPILGRSQVCHIEG